jgi:hypothetical protein
MSFSIISLEDLEHNINTSAVLDRHRRSRLLECGGCGFLVGTTLVLALVRGVPNWRKIDVCTHFMTIGKHVKIRCTQGSDRNLSAANGKGGANHEHIF